MPLNKKSSTTNLFLKSRVLSIKDHRSMITKSRQEKGLKNKPISIFFEDDNKFKIVLLDYTTNETVLGLKERVLFEVDKEKKHSIIQTRAFKALFCDDNVFPDIKAGEFGNDTLLDKNIGEYFMVPKNHMPDTGQSNDSGIFNTTGHFTSSNRKNIYNTNVRFVGTEIKQRNFSDRLLSEILRGAIYMKYKKNINPTVKFFNFFVGENNIVPVDPAKKLSHYFKSLQVQDDEELYERGVLDIRIEFKGIVELELRFPNKKKMIVKINPIYSLSKLVGTIHTSIGSNYRLYVEKSDTPLSLETNIWNLESDKLIVKRRVGRPGYGDMDEIESLIVKNEIEEDEENCYNVKFNDNQGPLIEGKFSYKNKLFHLAETRKFLLYNTIKGGFHQEFRGVDVAEISQNNFDNGFTLRIINNKGKLEKLNIFTEDSETKTKLIGMILLFK